MSAARGIWVQYKATMATARLPNPHKVLFANATDRYTHPQLSVKA